MGSVNETQTDHGDGVTAITIEYIASKWQREGERNLRRALDAVMALAPTVVLIDEVDQVVSRGNGSNQQDSRMFDN